MGFRIIDIEKWDRKEYFEQYFYENPCSYSMSVKIDITTIKLNNKKLYPTMLYFITKVVNEYDEFKISFNCNNQLGIFDKVIPSYTIFNNETKKFLNVWTDFSFDYKKFCKDYEEDVLKFSSAKKMFAKYCCPDNCFNVSMIPWASFEGFNLNLQKGYRYTLPIFTMGKYYEDNGRYILPLAIQVHHGVCDGYHLCRFINKLQECINNFIF